MPKRLHGRVAVVTGGGAGIGAAICQRLVEEGAKVLVADIDGDAASQVAQSMQNSTACQVRQNSTLEVCNHCLDTRRTVADRHVRRRSGQGTCGEGHSLEW